MTTMIYDVADLNLAAEGQRLIDWVAQEMPVLRLIRERFEREKPLRGLRLAGCLHITTETANLAIIFKAGGAELRLCVSNFLSTQDPVAAALVSNHGIFTYAVKGEDSARYSTFGCAVSSWSRRSPPSCCAPAIASMRCSSPTSRVSARRARS